MTTARTIHLHNLYSASFLSGPNVFFLTYTEIWGSTEEVGIKCLVDELLLHVSYFWTFFHELM